MITVQQRWNSLLNSVVWLLSTTLKTLFSPQGHVDNIQLLSMCQMDFMLMQCGLIQGNHSPCNSSYFAWRFTLLISPRRSLQASLEASKLLAEPLRFIIFSLLTSLWFSLRLIGFLLQTQKGHWYLLWNFRPTCNLQYFLCCVHSWYSNSF